MKTFKINRIYLVLNILLITSMTITLQAKTIRFVKINGTGNGSSWTNASASISTMIDNSVPGDEVWVAKGTYYPTDETIARNARSKTFLVKDGVSLYGGFAGIESAINQRILADLDTNGKIDSCELVNPTILNGNIDGVADVWTKTMNTDGKTWKWTVTGNEGNCYSVVTANSKIDGFSVMGGNANEISNLDGGGIKSNSSVTNCTISNCSAVFNGGGIYTSSSATSDYSSVTNCTVSNCSAGILGGGICASTSFTSITNCTVSNCSSISSGGGFYASDSLINCAVRDCSAGSNGGGISANSATNCIVSNCSAVTDGGGIYAHRVTDCTINNCSASNRGGGISAQDVTNCIVSNCSAGVNGGGIYTYYSVINCTVSNCLAASYGGGISCFLSVTTCTVSNCSSVTGGGIYAASGINCTVSNCSAASYGGGIYANSANNCSVSNCLAGIRGGGINADYSIYCAASNNKTAGIIGSGISNWPSNCILPIISEAYIKPTSFIGVATTDVQKLELLNANWRLKEGSPCINAVLLNIQASSVKDIDGKFRMQYGSIDIGAYEYTIPQILLSASENFNNWTEFEKSEMFYCSSQLNTLNDLKWVIENQKAVFSWNTNLTTNYSRQFFTYQVDGTLASKVFLRYDMYFQAYAGSFSPLGTEKLIVEFSTDLVSWSTLATYSNVNGTIANKTYKHDISAKAAGKTFFIQFRAVGENTNRIEKWEIDNVIIDADVLSTVNLISDSKYKYFVNNGNLIISSLEQGALVQLYDINGRLISSKNTDSQMSQLTLPAHGVYLVKVISDYGIENKKILW